VQATQHRFPLAVSCVSFCTRSLRERTDRQDTQTVTHHGLPFHNNRSGCLAARKLKRERVKTKRKEREKREIEGTRAGSRSNWRRHVQPTTFGVWLGPASRSARQRDARSVPCLKRCHILQAKQHERCRTPNKASLRKHWHAAKHSAVGRKGHQEHTQVATWHTANTVQSAARASRAHAAADCVNPAFRPAQYCKPIGSCWSSGC
jgi:hypothetical protein